MKRVRLAILISILPLLSFALLIEIVNPHSFLQHGGAFVRAAVATAAGLFWVWLSWRRWDWISKVGLAAITVAALLYWTYGAQDLCHDNLTLLEPRERSDGVSLFGDCVTVFGRMSSNGTPGAD